MFEVQKRSIPALSLDLIVLLKCVTQPHRPANLLASADDSRDLARNEELCPVKGLKTYDRHC